MDRSKKTKHPPLLLSLGLMMAIVGCLVVLTIIWKKPVIEVDLLQRTRLLLYQLLPEMDVQVAIDGRDAIIYAPPEYTDVLNKQTPTLQAIRGIHKVRIEQVDTVLPLQYPTDLTNDQFRNGLFTPSASHPLEKINLNTIQFQYATNKLLPSSLAKLQQLAKQIQQYPNQMIEISAHTSNQGTALGNMVLSHSRAEEVVRYLVQQGVREENLIAQGYGATRPIMTNATTTGQQINQRIALTILKE